MEKCELGRELSSTELRKIQLNVLTAIDEFCRANSIRYSLAYGSLLGAVRHGGYIPWDDDIDIFIQRDEYSKLLELFPDTYKQHFKIASLSRDPLYLRPYAKAYDDETVLVEHVKDKKCIGVNIDIFPIDNVPNDWKKWKLYDRKRRRINTLFRLRFVKLRKSRSIWKNLILVLLNIVTFPISLRRWAEYMDKMAQRYRIMNGTYCYDNSNGIYKIKRYEKKWFDNLIDISFEDKRFMAFADYDECLSITYGDYMTPPPVEKRQTRHSFNAYYKK